MPSRLPVAPGWLRVMLALGLFCWSPAWGPVGSPAAAQSGADRGVTILPDILTNAGGVTVSYFEWVQNLQHYKWGINRVRQELGHVLGAAFEKVWQDSHDRNIGLRTAAYSLAIERVHRATMLAGF